MFEDEYLMAFINDIKSIGIIISNCIQFVLGISYISGKYLVEFFTSVAEFVYYSCISFTYFIESLSEALVQIWSNLFHGILLTYYGIGKVGEAFYITFTDILNLLNNIFTSFSQLINFCVSLVGNSLSFLKVVPSQLNTTLSLVGDLFVTIFTQVLYILRHFVISLIWSPIYALQVLCKWSWFFFFHLPKSLIQMSTETFTLSAIIGLCVLILLGYMYSRLTFVQLITRIRLWSRNGSRRLYRILLRIFKTFKSTAQATNINNNDGNNEDEDDRKDTTRGICVVCQEKTVCFISSPCNHVCLCRDCVHRLVEYDNRCPICRNTVEFFSRVYIS